ncbi:hypothetical protein ABZ897_32695 [Nonomuraea sp. NPDC046802]|uniref:hypothetical protein n=1 Tax=Nonomuraea sp. NPDC046802 TaxID=3154919 RepID=UPI00340443AD
MKRLLAAAAAAAALVSASPAQAAPTVTPTPTAPPVAAKPVAAPDPVKALKSQFVAGRGVKVSESLRMEAKGKKLTSVQFSGVYEFGPSGVVSADVTQRVRTPQGKKVADVRFLIVGKNVYLQNDAVKADMPEGKTWVRFENSGKPYPANHPLDVLQPADLERLIKRAKPAKNGVYQGSITAKQVRDLKIRMRVPFTYRLSLDSAGLPSAFRSTLQYNNKSTTQRILDSRYSAWGQKVTIKAPAEEQVIDIKDLGPALQEEIQELPNEALASLRP